MTLLFKHWSEFGDVIIEYGTMKSPQCEKRLDIKSKLIEDFLLRLNFLKIERERYWRYLVKELLFLLSKAHLIS